MGNIILSILVDNQAGVLSRISGLFSRRGYNIESLTASVIEGNRTRITLVATGEKEELSQIERQVSKLVDVIEVKELPVQTSVCRELILVKVQVLPEDRAQIISIADIFRAKIVDVSIDTMILELTDDKDKVENCLRLLEAFTIKELVRTGITGLLRDSSNL